MRRISLIFPLVLSLLLIWQCSDNPVDSAPEPPRELNQAEKQLVERNESFALKLFREMNRTEGDKNIFMSPLSVAMALGMTYNGANGETREAMAEALELQGLSILEVNESYKSLIDLLDSTDPKVAFTLANSIWYLETYSVEQEFVDLNKNYFDALVTPIDFSAPDAADRMNDWVEENTNGLIKDMVTSIDRGTVMMLFNAIYFKGIWTTQFDKQDTYDGNFFTSDSDTVDCKLMRQEVDLRVYYGDDFMAIDLPYGYGYYSMTILLPREVDGVDALVEQMTTEHWNSWLDGLVDANEEIILPKFKLEYELQMEEVLTNLGMGVAFLPSADFTNINRNGGIWISEVKHKAFVSVDEEGTEAAAATQVVIIRSAPMSLIVNHPFIFVIHEHNSDAILFMGKVVDPTAE